MEEGYNQLNNSHHDFRSEKSGLEDLLRENMRYSRAIFVDMQKIKRHMLWRNIFNIIWLVLFIAPIIAAFFWLPQFISGFASQLQGLTGQSTGTVDLLNQLKQIK